MTGKPKSFDEAFEQLEKMTEMGGEQFSDKIREEFARLESQFNAFKPKMDELKDKFQSELNKTKGRVETQVRENPWTTLGVVGLLFFVIGYLFASRRRRGSD